MIGEDDCCTLMITLSKLLTPAMGDFTFWLSLWLRPKLSPKIGLSPKISQK